MIATVLDTVTLQTRIIEGIRSFEWAEKNWTCDCYRAPNFDAYSPCKSDRYIVIDAEFDDERDYKYSLEELKANYPKELLRKHGVLVAREAHFS